MAILAASHAPPHLCDERSLPQVGPRELLEVLELIVARAIVPLDVDFIVAESVLGTEHALEITLGPGRLLMPVAESGVGTAIRAPEDLHVVEQHWGDWTSYSQAAGTGQVALASLGFEIELVHANLDFPVDQLDQGYACGLEKLERELRSWTRRFQQWGQVLARQPLSLLEPSPKTISAPSASPVTWITVDSVSSWPATGQSGLKIVEETGLSPLSERVADIRTVQRMTELANDSMQESPPAVSLVSSARNAAQRGQLRLALMEMGTALEALLTRVLQLPPGHRETLGPLTARALKAGVPLPVDVQTSFVRPRNEAVHQGVMPSHKTVLTALAMVDGLIEQYLPMFACDPSLVPAHRVQRYDLRIIKPPRRG